MIRFNINRYRHNSNGELFLKYEDIENMTEELLEDYDRSLLTNPHAIQYDDFLEGYLGATIDYQYIYTESSGTTILGCTVFNEQRIRVFDPDNFRTKYIKYNPGTIIIGNETVEGNRKIQENITGLHEGGHFWMHSEQFADIEGQQQMNMQSGMICCRKSDIEQINALDKVHPTAAEMWREWQANIFAVTIALPRKSLIVSVGNLFREYGVDTNQLITDADEKSRYIAEQEIPEALKAIYNISKEAIIYRLYRTGFYCTKKQYDEEQSFKQMNLLDFI